MSAPCSLEVIRENPLGNRLVVCEGTDNDLFHKSNELRLILKRVKNCYRRN